jgi:CRP-like cAMP-binding protein
VTEAFQYLTRADRDLLVEKGALREYADGDVILEEGDRRRILYVILEGRCRVEVSHLGRGVAIAHMGPDEFFGDMSFLEGQGASASVVADGPAKVLSVTPDHIQSLLQSAPGLSTRFYQSLAVNLSRRLRDRTAMLPPLLVEEVAQVKPFHSATTGHPGHGKLPPGLVADVEAFKTAMLAIDREIIAARPARR